jgi:hypothetical protein
MITQRMKLAPAVVCAAVTASCSEPLGNEEPTVTTPRESQDENGFRAPEAIIAEMQGEPRSEPGTESWEDLSWSSLFDESDTLLGDEVFDEAGDLQCSPS